MSPSPSTASATAATPTNRFARRKMIILWEMTGFAVLLGLLLASGEVAEGIVLLLEFVLLLFAIAWCYADANERNHRIGGAMRFGLVLLFVVAFPIYLFQTRGWRGFITLAAAIVFFVFLQVLISFWTMV